MSFLFGESPTVKTNTAPTITAPQGGILAMLQSLLETGAVPTGTTGLGVRSYTGQLNPMQPDQFAAPMNSLQTTSLEGLEQQARTAGSVPPIDQNSLTQSLYQALGWQPPFVGAPSPVSGAPAITPDTVSAGPPVQSGAYSNMNIGARDVGLPPWITGMNVGTSSTAPAIDATDAFRRGVVEPMTTDFLQRALPSIAGKYGQGAGGAFSSDALGARTQAATDLERVLAQTGSQYSLSAAQANQQAELQTRQRVLEAAMSNQATDLTAQRANQSGYLTTQLANQASDLTAQQSNQAEFARANQFNIQAALEAALNNQKTAFAAQSANQSADLQAALANKEALLRGELANQQSQLTTNAQNIGAVGQTRADILGALGTAPAVAQTEPNQQASIIGNLIQTLTGGNVPWNIAQTQVQGRVQDFYKTLDQTQQRLADMIAAFSPQTLQTTSVAQGGSTGLLGGLLGGIGSLATPGAGGVSALGNIFSAALPLLGLSDERLKEDFEKVGEVDGFPLYKFRWRGDDDNVTYVGFKAQEVERKRPSVVSRVPGTDVRVVNYGKIISDALEAA